MEATHNPPPVLIQSCPNLARIVHVTLEGNTLVIFTVQTAGKQSELTLHFDLERLVRHPIEPHPRIVRRDEDTLVRWVGGRVEELDVSDLLARRVFATGAPNAHRAEERTAATEPGSVNHPDSRIRRRNDSQGVVKEEQLPRERSARPHFPVCPKCNGRDSLRDLGNGSDLALDDGPDSELGVAPA